MYAELRQLVFKLPVEQRQDLAHELIVDLAGVSEELADQSCVDIVKQRKQEIENGEAVMMDGGQFMKEIRQEFGW